MELIKNMSYFDGTVSFIKISNGIEDVCITIVVTTTISSFEVLRNIDEFLWRNHYFGSSSNYHRYSFPNVVDQYKYTKKNTQKIIQHYKKLEENFKNEFPSNQITILYKPKVWEAVATIVMYWRKYRWNYLRNLAAWRYHPSKLTFDLD